MGAREDRGARSGRCRAHRGARTVGHRGVAPALRGHRLPTRLALRRQVRHRPEHGLHLWFGGYDNAFRLLADCYAELDRPADHPMPTIDSAWAPLTSVVLYDRYDDRWSYLYREYPVLPGLPWDEPGEPRFWDVLATIV